MRFILTNVPTDPPRNFTSSMLASTVSEFLIAHRRAENHWPPYDGGRLIASIFNYLYAWINRPRTGRRTFLFHFSTMLAYAARGRRCVCEILIANRLSSPIAAARWSIRNRMCSHLHIRIVGIVNHRLLSVPTAITPSS